MPSDAERTVLAADLLGSLPVPLSDQIAEVEREIALRKRVYPRWIGAGNLKPATAARHIANMEAVLETLKRCR